MISYRLKVVELPAPLVNNETAPPDIWFPILGM
jgi:hypothetical protein